MLKEFELEAYRKGQELLVVMRGRLVLRFCQDVKTNLASLFSSQINRAYVYLGELTFLDSAGLGVLVGTKTQAKRGNIDLTFLSPPPRVEDIFRVSKLDGIFDITGGPEADVIYATMKREEYCIWSDSRDRAQTQHVTEYSTGSRGATSGNITQLPQDRTEDPASAGVRRLCEEAVEHLRAGRYENAIEVYKRALQIDPHNISALNNLGVVYEKRPEWYALSLQTWNTLLDISQKVGDEKHAARARKHIESLEKLIKAG